MNQTEQLKIQKLMLKGVMADLPQEDRQKIYDAVEQIKVLVDPLGQHGLMALSLCTIDAGLATEENK